MKKFLTEQKLSLHIKINEFDTEIDIKIPSSKISMYEDDLYDYLIDTYGEDTAEQINADDNIRDEIFNLYLTYRLLADFEELLDKSYIGLKAERYMNEFVDTLDDYIQKIKKGD